MQREGSTTKVGTGVRTNIFSLKTPMTCETFFFIALAGKQQSSGS
jgi:hypothetical protein